MLRADAEHLSHMVGRRGGSCRLTIWPGQVHVFQVLFALLPESQAAIFEAGAWIDARLPAHGGAPVTGEAAAA
jgi:acetyl esterase/lipase